jgi:hypothetical protein
VTLALGAQRAIGALHLLELHDCRLVRLSLGFTLIKHFKRLDKSSEYTLLIRE